MMDRPGILVLRGVDCAEDPASVEIRMCDNGSFDPFSYRLDLWHEDVSTEYPWCSHIVSHRDVERMRERFDAWMRHAASSAILVLLRHDEGRAPLEHERHPGDDGHAILDYLSFSARYGGVCWGIYYSGRRITDTGDIIDATTHDIALMLDAMWHGIGIDVLEPRS